MFLIVINKLFVKHFARVSAFCAGGRGSNTVRDVSVSGDLVVDGDTLVKSLHIGDHDMICLA
jgi:hypothetical protein